MRRGSPELHRARQAHIACRAAGDWTGAAHALDVAALHARQDGMAMLAYGMLVEAGVCRDRAAGKRPPPEPEPPKPPVRRWVMDGPQAALPLTPPPEPEPPPPMPPPPEQELDLFLSPGVW